VIYPVDSIIQPFNNWGQGDKLLHLNFKVSNSFLTGLEQSMKPMIGKSIDQSMTIDAN